MEEAESDLCKNWIGQSRILWNSRPWLQQHSSLRCLDQAERKSDFSGIACIAQNDWGDGRISGFLVHAPRDERDSHLQVNSLLFLDHQLGGKTNPFNHHSWPLRLPDFSGWSLLLPSLTELASDSVAHHYALFLCSMDVERESSWSTNYW